MTLRFRAPGRMSVALCVGAALTACNADSPTELGSFEAFRIEGTWGFTITSQAGCAPDQLEARIAQFDTGVAGDTLRLIGSWQVVGEPKSFDLEGRVGRKTGTVVLELTATRSMQGIFLDNRSAALGYTDSATGCQGRASGRRIG